MGTSQTKIISIFNNKGGVGKTTITWNLGDAIARRDKKVLLIDFDPQCNLSIAVLGEEKFTKVLPTENVPYGTTLRAYLQRFLQNTDGTEIFTHKGNLTHHNVDLLAGDFWLNVYSEAISVGSDLLTGTGISRYSVIKRLVDQANAKSMEGSGYEYDYVLVDLPPSFGNLVRVALYSSSHFIVPCTSDNFSAYCVGLIGNMLPSFLEDWRVGRNRFNTANPNLDLYGKIGSPAFAGWIFNGFDMRNKKRIQADEVYYEKMKNAVSKDLVENLRSSPAGPSSVLANHPPDFLLGQVEDMNVLVQNSILLSCPIAILDQQQQVKDLQDRRSWTDNQKGQIDDLRKAFMQIADNVINYCV